jgi:hypothetical protein
VPLSNFLFDFATLSGRGLVIDNAFYMTSYILSAQGALLLCRRAISVLRTVALIVSTLAVIVSATLTTQARRLDHV